MEWVDCPESSNIERFGYDTDTQVLTVEFKKGGIYSYYDVPEVIFEQMKSASSKGAFLAAQVKARYRYARQ